MKKVDLTQGNVFKVLTLLTIPIVGSSLLQFTYNLIDMIWVGRLGSDAVASIGSSSFFLGLGLSINALVVIGGGIKISHALGRNDEDDVRSYINNALFINLIIATIYSLGIFFFGKYLIGFLEISEVNVREDAIAYLKICAPSMFFSFFNLLYVRIFGCYGRNSNALKISATGVIINIILDPICIYILNFGVLGAGIATLIANFTMFILFNIKSNGLFKFDSKISLDKAKLLEISRLGIPMASQRVLFTIVNIVLARIISMFGADAIAGQKIGLQIESITFMIIGGLNIAVSSYTGQNFGAKEYKRVIEGYRAALKLGVIYALVTSSIFLLVPDLLASIFVSDKNTIEISSIYIRIIALSQVFSAIEMISNGLFTGLGMPKIPANISIVFTILRIPFALFFINYLGINGVWVSICLSSILKGITAYIMYLIKVRKDPKYAL
ncbi:MAG: MATE family efflux transporter [Peptostreptococcaceae bacterium]